ncbi:MAG: type IV pilus assembly protein PilM [Kiritimatiellae bacterium]|nr:type IV pilus assembly protein PilM [Kiritimatiellia bacterium]
MARKIQTLNIGASSVELAEYEAGAKGALTLVNYGTALLAAPLDAENAETVLPPALTEIVREKGIRPGKVAISVSGQMVFPRFAAIPAAGGDDRFEQMVCYEIEQNIPFPIDEMVCDRQILGDTETGDKSVMIVAAKVDQVEALTNAVSSVGFVPELVDAAPIALTNALRFCGDDGGCAVLLDVGARTTSLVIVEGDKIYNRSIPVAGNTVTKEVAAALGCTAEEAEQLKLEKGYVSMGGVTEDEDEVADRIAKVCRAVLTRLHAEISRSINFYRSQQGGSAPSRLYLAGGSALLPQLDVFFAESLQIEVEHFNPFEAIGVGPKVDAEALAYDAARIASTAGLALHMAGSARFKVNLLPPSLVAARAERAKIPFVVAAGVAVVAGLVLVMLAIGRDTAVIEAERDAVQVRVDSLSRFDRQVKAGEQALAAEAADADAVRELLFARIGAANRMFAVRSSLLPGMWVQKWAADRVVVRYWKDRVKATGGKTPGEVVVKNLRGKPVVEPDSVKISDMSAVGKDAQVVQFTVELKFK